ncbi:MAG TPA: SpoIIE family protein phosphatase, partial [Ignavibacteriaceae bacterium]
LERVRARTMAMQKSEELSETSFVLFTQLKELGEVAEQISILIYDEKDEIFELYTTIYGNQWEESGRLPFNENPVHKKIYTTWKEKKKSFVIDLSGDELTDFNNFKMKYSNQYKSESELPKNRWILHSAFFTKGAITYSTHEPRPAETLTLLERFAAVFDLTYTRFLDLKKAEAQAREAQIEAALERIRSRSLAMQKSEELAETAAVLFQQLHELGYVPDRITIGIIKEDIRSIELWSTDQVGNKITHIFKPSIEETTTWSKIYNQWKAKAKSLVIDLSGKELNEWIRYVREEMHMFINEEVLKENRRVHSVSFFSHGFIMMSTIEAMPVEKIDVLERFSLVFNQTYTRFLDLKKAEYQAREAQIEVALERVRSKTLAMHTSEELAKTSSVVFQQLINLGIEPNRIYIAIIKNDKGDAEFWITNEDGSKVNSGFEVNLNDNSSFKKMFEGWKEHKKSMTIDMQGEELKEYFNHLTRLGVQFNEGLSQKRRMQYVGYFSKGFIGIASPDETKPETLLLLERFAAVFNLTYTRFNDLLQAEEQNRIIQAENERKTKELEDARRLQISMLPKELPRLPRLDIAVYMKTTTEVGGDYYDFSIDNNGTLTFIVGDATGHGLMSGMMVSIMKSFFISNRNHISLKDFFENANNSIKDMKLGRLMMALMGVQITSDEIIATSAGMPPLIYYRNKSGKAGEFVINNLPLGGMKGIKYSLKKIKYEKGDTLLMMSDGFAESKNYKGEQFGYEKVKKEFKSVIQKKSNEIVKHLTYVSSKWIDGKEPEDDITFVVIKIK